MRKKIKKLWIEALRSGDYTQGYNYLRKGDTYDCLGVLTDLYIKSGLTERGWESYKELGIEPRDVYHFMGESYVLHDEVEEWSGLVGDDRYLKTPDGNLSDIASLNDGTVGESCTLEELADLIEKQL